MFFPSSHHRVYAVEDQFPSDRCGLATLHSHQARDQGQHPIGCCIPLVHLEIAMYPVSTVEYIDVEYCPVNSDYICSTVLPTLDFPVSITLLDQCILERGAPQFSTLPVSNAYARLL